MTHHLPPSEFSTAIRDFRVARRRAAVQDILAWLTGKPADLLSFDESKKLLKGEAAVYRGLREIPLEAIIGSVGRYRDFTRSFLPRRESDENRWARVKTEIPNVGFNPIEVYQIGEAYFVLDGNHRVSIAKARGDSTIQAYVTEIPTKVSLAPEDSPDDLIRKAEMVDFLEQTRLDVTRPDTDFSTTAPGGYAALTYRIAQMRDDFPDLEWPDLAVKWHDDEYLLFADRIRRKGLRRDFPGRTVTDLYAWLINKQGELHKRLGWRVSLEVAAENLLEESSPRVRRVAARVRSRLADLATPDPFESGPKAGIWRQWALATHRTDQLFTDYLVPISGSASSWLALEQALLFAKLEQDFVHGLYVLPVDRKKDIARVAATRDEFKRRLASAGVSGELTVEIGSVARKICDNAAWADLVIMNIAHPPGSSPLDKAASGLRTIIHRSPRPLILVPAVSEQFSKLLLAYDGSPKSNEALYVSAYLTGKWGLSLTVLTVVSAHTRPDTLQSARDYLGRHQISADYFLEEGSPAERILEAADKTACDTILMGGYGYSSVLEMVLGSAVDRVLREARVPIFLCR